MSEAFRSEVFPVRWRTRLRLRAVAGIVAAALLVTGCAGSSEQPEDPAPTAPATPTPSETEPPSTSKPGPSATPSDNPTTEPTANWTRDDLLVTVEWVTREGEVSLAVDPTELVRMGGLAEANAAWREVVAEFPDADTEGMRMQFDCHWIGAKDKDQWFLEPWRPDVTVPEMLVARCNPE